MTARDSTRTEQALLDTPCKRWKTRQAVVLDWSDGPREGFCALATPEYEFYFELYSEKRSPRDLDNRLFLISKIRTGSVARVMKTLAPLGNATRTVWVPQWDFESESQRLNAELVLAAILKSKRSTGVIVRTQDMQTFSDCLSVSRDIKKFLTWFEYKGQHAS